MAGQSLKPKKGPPAQGNRAEKARPLAHYVGFDHSTESIMEAPKGLGRVVLFVAGMGLSEAKIKNQAATYSPGARRPQYHRRWRA